VDHSIGYIALPILVQVAGGSATSVISPQCLGQVGRFDLRTQRLAASDGFSTNTMNMVATSKEIAIVAIHIRIGVSPTTGFKGHLRVSGIPSIY